MSNNPPTSTAKLRAVWLASTILGRPLSALLACCTLLLSGCATSPTSAVREQAVQTLPTDTVHTQVTQTLLGMPVKITRIPVPFSGIGGHGNAQAALGYIWATRSSPLGLHKTVRIDAKSYQVTELSRPFTVGGADLLIAENSIWFSGYAVSGDLYRADPHTNQIAVTIGGVGSPFASGDGAVWAYNHGTRVVTGIDTKDNQIRTQLVTQGSPYDDLYAFGAGSIWQFAYEREVSSWQLVRGAIPPSVVRRIDPSSRKVIAEISIGPFRPTDQIRFVAGAVWVLGWRDTSGMAFATQIDVKTNRVTATIPFQRGTECIAQTTPKTPVHWKDGIWVSTGCPGLQRIDLQTNQVTDVIRWRQQGQPVLAAGEGALWGFYERSAIRFEF